MKCGLTYKYNASGCLDMRLRKPRKYDLQFELGTTLLPKEGFQFEPLTINNNPEVDYSGVEIPERLSEEIVSFFPKAKSSDSLMLDLGCGNAVHKSVCERAGFEWVGLDYDSEKALILGDAHALPFKSETFSFILSIAVLEHIRFPFVMMREAYRVLKPHGKIIGTVAFLEPFHGDSFYHHTHLGTFNSLQFAGFTIEKLAPSEKWPVLMAQASMSLFPYAPRFISKSIVYPVQLLHKIWWSVGGMILRKNTKSNRIRNTTGAFVFIATKNEM
ncbi:MAG: class I SAM-dependent methyltransferase [bacterium]|nr:class I SAM-dependent methyltransferase [bacterium]